MYLKELILEGFKSYAQKTVVKPFDKHFNAITGLNGSGKSNILDSLIFLLGIVGYKDLRASDSKDLIYKQGSAGITTATVTGVFDNSDSKRSPNGYQHYETITVSRSILATGQSKYSINNTTCTQAKVQELFQSVQLNVLNPHFIIMQGRIAKVCNMKPTELLRLIEEATGTSMYENKRDTVLKNMDKRETTLKQAADKMQIINHKKDELAQKVKKHEEYRRLTPHIDLLQRKLAAIKYLELKRHHDEALDDKTRFETDKTRTHIALQQGAAEVEQFKSECEQIRQEQEDSMEGKMAKAEADELKKKEQEAGVTLDRLRNESRVSNDSVAKLVKKTEILQGGFQDQEREFEAKKLEYKEALEAETAAKDYIETLSNTIDGVAAEPSTGQGGGFEDKKASEEESLRNAETQVHVINSQLSGLHDTLVEERRKQNIDKAQHERLSADLMLLNQNTAALEDRLTATAREYCAIVSVVLAGRSVNSVHPDELERTRDFSFENATTILNQQHQGVTTAIQNGYAQLSQMNNMTNNPLNKPEWSSITNKIGLFDTLNKSDVDPQNLYGAVVNLFSITDPQQWGLALEVAGGLKLFNIVVKTYDTGARLLRSNQRSNATITLLALDRIRFHVNHHLIQEIRNRYGDRAVLARDVVTPHPHAPPAFSNALDSIFGGVFLCSDASVAKAVASAGVRAITVQGDSYEPGGSISGGSLTGMNWLKEFARAKSQGEKAEEFSRSLRGLEQFETQLTQLFGDLNSLRNMKQDIVHKTERQKRSGFQRSLDNIIRIETELAKKREEVTALETKMTRSRAVIKDYTEKIQGLRGSDGERRKQEMKTELEDKKKNLVKVAAIAKKLKIHCEELRDELKSHEERKQELENDLDQQRRATERISKDFEKAQLAHQSAVDNANRAAKRWDEIVKKNEAVADSLKRLESEIQKCEAARQKNENRLGELKTQIKDAEHRTEASKKEIQSALQANSWIKDEEARFNVHGSEFDFRGATVNDIEQELQQTKDRRNAFKKYDDPLCLEHYDQLNKDFKDTTSKFKDVVSDRDALKKSIEILDLKKTETVENTYKVVDRYFGQIFSILLPGAQSRLKPHRNADGTLTGCEMQVAFNNKWKDSLSELSGGQRSLLALSLILALLRCKPAPLYILDEVDAALDASHTQNIGKTIKEHFEQSQFIIVSLKEGMFENANVLIRTQLGPNGSMLTVNRRTSD